MLCFIIQYFIFLVLNVIILSVKSLVELMVIQDCHNWCMCKRHRDCTHYMINVRSAVNIHDRYSEEYVSGFGGLVVSMLASGTQDHGFTPGQSRWIFRAKKSSACLPLEGK
jgi:hypothetical protein